MTISLLLLVLLLKLDPSIVTIPVVTTLEVNTNDCKYDGLHYEFYLRHTEVITCQNYIIKNPVSVSKGIVSTIEVNCLYRQYLYEDINGSVKSRFST